MHDYHDPHGYPQAPYAHPGYPHPGSAHGHAPGLGYPPAPGPIPGPHGPGYPYLHAAQGYPGATPFFNFGSDRFLKGLLIGAAAAYLITNESVQRSAIKGVVKAWSLVQGGAEELKERFHDAEAEIRAAEAGEA